MATILVELLSSSKEFKADLDKAVASTEKANSGFSKMGKVAGVAGLAIAGGLAYGLTKSVEAAGQMQQATTRMNAAFAASHVSVKAFSGAIEEAEGAARKLGFENADVKNSLGSLVIATHNGKQAISDLGVAEDIARFKHTSLENATKTLAMAMTGSQRAAKQLGITIQKSTENYDAVYLAHKKATEALRAEYPITSKSTQAEKDLYQAKKDTLDTQFKADSASAHFADTQVTASKVIATVSEKLHGQADAYSQTAAGGMAQFDAQMNSLEESIGAGLLPAMTAAASELATLGNFLAEHTTLAKALVIGLGALAGVLLSVSIATKLQAAYTSIVSAATTVWTGAQWLLNAALDANPIGIVIVAVAALTAGIILAYTHSATFRSIVTGALNAVSTAAKDVLDFFRNNWPLIATLISGPFAPIVLLATNAFGVRSALTGAFQDVKDWLDNHWQEIATIISGPFAPLVALATNAFGIRDKLTSAFNDMKTDLSTWLTTVVSWVGGLPDRIVKALGDTSHLLVSAGEAIITGLITGMKGKLGDLKTFATGIAGDLTNWKGPIEYDRVLLVPQGQAIMQGLQAGMESGLGSLKTMTSGIAPSISANIGSSPVSAPTGSGGGGGHTFNFYGWVADKQAVVEAIRSELIRTGMNTTGGALGGFG